MYNGINSSIDAMRGKHDILGSMGAGGLTGALFKSTGARVTFRMNRLCYSHTFSTVSWGKTCARSGDIYVRYGRDMELCEKECLIFCM